MTRVIGDVIMVEITHFVTGMAVQSCVLPLISWGSSVKFWLSNQDKSRLVSNER